MKVRYLKTSANSEGVFSVGSVRDLDMRLKKNKALLDSGFVEPLETASFESGEMETATVKEPVKRRK